MNIRTATPEDVSTLNKLVNSAYRGDSSRQGWTTEADLLDGIRTSEAALHEMMKKTGAVILVAEEDDEILACVYLERKNAVLYLGMLTVRPHLQAKGLGALLMNAAEEIAQALHCRSIQMTVISERENLIAYYKRKGYTDTGERLPFPNDPAFGIPKKSLQFIVMEKQLPI